MVDEDLGGLMFMTSDLELKTFGTKKTLERKRPQSGGVWLRTEDAFGMEDDFEKVGCGGGSEMNSESCGFLGGSS